MAESGLQYVSLTETISALRTRFIDRTGVYLAGDMLVYYRMNDNTVSVAPDLFAVLVALEIAHEGPGSYGVRERFPVWWWRLRQRAPGAGTSTKNGTSTQGWALPNTGGSIPRAGGSRRRWWGSGWWVVNIKPILVLEDSSGAL